MLSASFDNHCSLCRAQIVKLRATGERLSRALAYPFAPLEILAVIASNGVSQMQTSQLLKFFGNSTLNSTLVCRLLFL